MKRHGSNAKLIAGSLTVLFLGLSLQAYFAPRFSGDLEATLHLQSFHSMSLLAVMKVVSYLSGEWRAAFVVIIACVIIWFRVGRLEAGLVAFSGLLTITNEIFKAVVARPRPTTTIVNVFVIETGMFPVGTPCSLYSSWEC